MIKINFLWKENKYVYAPRYDDIWYVPSLLDKTVRRVFVWNMIMYLSWIALNYIEIVRLYDEEYYGYVNIASKYNISKTIVKRIKTIFKVI